MKKLVTGILIGIAATLLVQRAYWMWQIHRFKQDSELQLPGVVENLVNNDLQGARFLDVSWSASTDHGNFTHDKLYDVHVSYERNRKIKRFTTTIGLAGGAWVTPSASDLEILDEGAKIISTKSGNVEPPGGAYVAPVEGAPSAHP